MANIEALDQVHAVMDQAHSVVDDAIAKGKRLYSDAAEWVPENRGVIAAVGGGVLAAGLIGFALGRSSKRSMLESKVSELGKHASSAANSAAGKIGDFDLGPAFKFLKLWMLYRLAV